MLELFSANAEMRRAAAALDRQMLRFEDLAEEVFGKVQAGESACRTDRRWNSVPD